MKSLILCYSILSLTLYNYLASSGSVRQVSKFCTIWSISLKLPQLYLHIGSQTGLSSRRHVRRLSCTSSTQTDLVIAHENAHDLLLPSDDSNQMHVPHLSFRLDSILASPRSCVSLLAVYLREHAYTIPITPSIASKPIQIWVQLFGGPTVPLTARDSRLFHLCLLLYVIPAPS